LGIGILLIAFPKAHGIVLTSLYIPVTIMLMALILRGVAFDFRVKAGDDKKKRWNLAFFVGSLVASLAQGWMLGSFITGLQPGFINYLFSGLIAITLPSLYVVLGCGWLMIKTEGRLFDKAMYWGRISVIPMGAVLILMSIATPLVNQSIAEKWFTLPNAIGLLPIPLSCTVAYLVVFWVLSRPDVAKAGYAWLVMGGTVSICVMSCIGLAYSIYPYIVLDQLTIWEAASATESLQFVLVGVLITLPAILAYTFFVYRIFAGKAEALTYE
jgi:cytochrome d ubiquinol oxidase subunit II